MSVTRKADSPLGRMISSFQKIRADYNMSRPSRFVRRRTGLPAQGNSADWHYRNEADYYRDIESARDMDRNDSIVGQTVDRAVANIVQDGFTLDTRTGDKALDRDLKARWLAESCDPEAIDIAGEFCFHDFETLSCRGMLVDGDCVNMATEEGHLQHLEAHTIQTSTNVDNTFLGVTRDPFGRRTHYWVMTDPNDPVRGRRNNAVQRSVRNEEGHRTLFHVMRPKRMSQTRGITAFAPVFELTGMFEDVQFAKVVQQQIVSCFTIFRSREYIPDLPGTTTPGYGNTETETTSAGTRQIDNIAPGMEIVGQPGEKLEGFSPNVPNAEYFMHVKLMLQMIGCNLGLPLCLVLMDGSETNFSGWRGAVDEARKGFRSNQKNLAQRFHKPFFEMKVRQWMAEDAPLRQAANRSGIDPFNHKWNPPTWAYIDPVGDAQGDVIRLQNGLISPRRRAAERGLEDEELTEEIVSDRGNMVRRAMQEAEEVNKNFPNQPPVHWSTFATIPMADGIQMTMQDPNIVELQTDQQKSKDEGVPSGN